MSKHQTQKIKRCGDTASIAVYFIVRKSKLRFAVRLCLLGLALALILRTFPEYSFFLWESLVLPANHPPSPSGREHEVGLFFWLPVNRKGEGTVVGF